MSNSTLLNKRFWYKALKKSIRKVTPHHKKLKEEDYLFLKDLFERAGGSWVGLSEGDLEDWNLLRECCCTFLLERKEKGDRPFEEEDSDN